MVIDEIVQRLRSDPALVAKYSALPDVAAIQAQAAKDGLTVSASDVQAVIQAMSARTGELSDNDLASVAGGKSDREKPPDFWFTQRRGHSDPM